MLKFTAFLLMALAVFAADDPWTKVSAVKSGTELRILKRGSKQPVLAKMDELTESSLIVIVKNEQVAIPREEIERIDARPAQAGSRVTKETKTSREVAGPAMQPAQSRIMREVLPRQAPAQLPSVRKPSSRRSTPGWRPLR